MVTLFKFRSDKWTHVRRVDPGFVSRLNLERGMRERCPVCRAWEGFVMKHLFIETLESLRPGNS